MLRDNVPDQNMVSVEKTRILDPVFTVFKSLKPVVRNQIERIICVQARARPEEFVDPQLINYSNFAAHRYAILLFELNVWR